MSYTTLLSDLEEYFRDFVAIPSANNWNKLETQMERYQEFVNNYQEFVNNGNQETPSKNATSTTDNMVSISFSNGITVRLACPVLDP